MTAPARLGLSRPMTRLCRFTGASAHGRLIAMFAGIALAGTGCGLSPAPSPASHRSPRGWVRTIAGTPPSAGLVTAVRRHEAIADANRLLASAVMPPGSRPVAQLPSRALAEPGQLPACNPIEDAGRLWMLHQAPAAVTAFLVGHVPPGTRNSVQGGSTSGGRPTSFVVVDDASQKGRDSTLVDTGAELVFTFAALDGQTELRVDAVTIPRGAGCMGG
jgi:hypothetical protein